MKHTIVGWHIFEYELTRKKIGYSRILAFKITTLQASKDLKQHNLYQGGVYVEK